MSPDPLTVAVETYDRHAPLLEGRAKSPQLDLRFIEVEQSGDAGRHEQFLQHGRWDAAELSFSSYLVAVDQGLEIQAVPIFPRRLFSQSQMYVNANAGIRGPEDLPGKRVGLSTYQTTLSVLAKGDLARYYGVPWQEITYVTSRPDTVKTVLPPEVKIERANGMQQIEAELVDGTIQAFFNPRPPRPFIEGDPRVARLFSDTQAEEQRHLREPGYFPIMHVAAFRSSAAERYPDLPRALFDVFEQARQMARQRWNDPNWSMLLWGKQELEREAALLPSDPWRNGLTANRKNIEDFVAYSHEQGCIRRLLTPEELFVAID